MITSPPTFTRVNFFKRVLEKSGLTAERKKKKNNNTQSELPLEKEVGHVRIFQGFFSPVIAEWSALKFYF